MNRDKFIFELAKLKPNQSFLKLHGYRSEYGQEIVASIVFNVPYARAIEQSIAALKGYFPQDPIYSAAKRELMGLFKNTLIKLSEKNKEEDNPDFLPFLDEKMRRVDGIKLHKPTCELHIFSFVKKKIISVEGNPYGRNIPRFSPTKESFKKICPALKFEKLKVSPRQVESVTVESLALLEF